jgi:steroid delta-isomerase-like uncharacterized protein
MSSTAPSPKSSPQALIDIAKTSILAYNEKNWNNVRTALTSDVLYDEVATQRKIQGLDQVIECWQGWARAFPDSKATFHNAMASGNMVCLELSWRGTHTGPLALPSAGAVPPTNRSIDIRACEVFEMLDNKAQIVRHYFDLASMMQQLGLGR